MESSNFKAPKDLGSSLATEFEGLTEDIGDFSVSVLGIIATTSLGGGTVKRPRFSRQFSLSLSKLSSEA